jgi:RHS repeat-associated protein
MPILKSSSLRKSDDILLCETAFKYATDSGNAGRLASRTRTHYANDGTGDQFVTTETFTCTDDSSLPGASLYERTVTTYDQLTRSSSRSRSRFTHRLWKEVNAQGVTDTFEYDGLGRLIKSTLAVGSSYEDVSGAGYVITGGEDEAFQVTLTDCNTNEVCRGFDGAGRLVYVAINDIDESIDDANYKVNSYTYDELGRRATATRADWLLEPDESYSSTATFGYDAWGKPFRVNRDDGSYRIKSYDPIALTTLIQTGGSDGKSTVNSGKTVVTYDIGKCPIKVQRFPPDADVSTETPYSCRTMTYDGLHRLRSETDELGNTTTYEYDGWGRATKTTLPATTDFDHKRTPNAVISRTYRRDSRATDVIKIEVNGCELGSRQFDGFGRLASATVGGRQGLYHYGSDADARPATVTAPDSVVRAYTYVAELGNKIETLTVPQNNPSITQTFGYNPLGQLSSATEGASTKNYTPLSSGRPNKETLTFDGIAGTAIYDRYSVAGKLYRYIYSDGAVRIVNRDQYGRVNDISDGAAKVMLHRDPSGRLTGWTAEDLTGNKHSLDVQLTLDDYGREVSRTFVENGTQEWKVTQEWNEKNLLTSRTTYHPTDQYRKETFSYDERNRLIDWTCSGALATDRYGHAMKEQTYYFDSLNNVTSVTTSFDDDSQNVATFVYSDANDPCKLTSLTNTHAAYPSSPALTYDDAGRLTNDGIGQTFGYDPLGRMNAAQSALSTKSGGYAYDAHNRIYKQTVDGQPGATYFYYKANALANVIQRQPGQPDSKVRIFRSRAGCVSQYLEENGAGSVWLTAADKSGSVLAASNGSNSDTFSYSPYGEDKPTAPKTVLGYTGQYRDPVVPGYQLGGGYRAYMPALMRFNASDSVSPFGKGGINTYAYCAGDPINRRDTDGHSFWDDLDSGLEDVKNTAEDVLQDVGDFLSNLSEGFAEGLAASVPGTQVQLGAARGVEGAGEVLGDAFNTFFSAPEMAEEEAGVEGVEAGLRALSEAGAIGEEAGGGVSGVLDASADSAALEMAGGSGATSSGAGFQDAPHTSDFDAPPHNLSRNGSVPYLDDLDMHSDPPPPNYFDTEPPPGPPAYEDHMPTIRRQNRWLRRIRHPLRSFRGFWNRTVYGFPRRMTEEEFNEFLRRRPLSWDPPEYREVEPIY